VVEGIAAIAIVFTLFTVAVQSAVLVLARQAAEAVVATSARRVASGSAMTGWQLGDALRRVVPAVAASEAQVTVNGGVATAWARISLTPPGPMLGAITFEVDAEVPLVVEP
jgi:predicted TIM-barrel enzyme